MLLNKLYFFLIFGYKIKGFLIVPDTSDIVINAEDVLETIPKILFQQYKNNNNEHHVNNEIELDDIDKKGLKTTLKILNQTGTLQYDDETENIPPIEPVKDSSFKFPWNSDSGESPRGGPMLIQTALAINRNISIYGKMIRESNLIGRRINNKRDYTIIFAPIDSAMKNLSLRPWKFPLPVEEAKNSREMDKMADKNLEAFISRHTMFNSGYIGAGRTTIDGHLIRLFLDDGIPFIKINVGGIPKARVLRMQQLLNGEIWTINGTLSSPEEDGLV